MSSAAALTSDPFRERMELRVSILQEMTQVCMQTMRELCVDAAIQCRVEKQTLRDAYGDKLTNEALIAAAALPKLRDPVGDLARLTRAVRLNLALEARTDEALRAYIDGVVVVTPPPAERAETPATPPQPDAAAEAEADEARQALHKANRRKMFDIVFEAAESEVHDRQDLADFEVALDQRLDKEPSMVAALEEFPLDTIIRFLCDELQLSPDWTRWTGDGWAPPDPDSAAAADDIPGVDNHRRLE